MTLLRNFSNSALRGIDVLEYLAARGTPARASEVASALGIAVSSADQLLKTMISGGYLIRIPQQRSYFPSPRLIPLGICVGTHYPSGVDLHNLLLEVHAATGEIATLTVQNDCTMQIFDAVDSEEEDRPDATKGRTFPVFGSVVGMAALTLKAPVQIRRLAQSARQHGAVSSDVANLSDFLKFLEPSRKAGYHARATRGSEDEPPRAEYWSIAMPAPIQAWTSPIVLGVAGPVARVRSRETHIVGVMRKALDRYIGVPMAQAAQGGSHPV